MISPITPKATIDWMLRGDRPLPLAAVEYCGMWVPMMPTIAPYVAETPAIPAISQPSGRTVARSRSRAERRWPMSGATAPSTATLQAVKVPARPVTNAKAIPASAPPMGVPFASWPSSVSATVPPMVLSTNAADQTTVSRKPARTLATMTRTRRRTDRCPVRVVGGITLIVVAACATFSPFVGAVFVGSSADALINENDRANNEEDESGEDAGRDEEPPRWWQVLGGRIGRSWAAAAVGFGHLISLILTADLPSCRVAAGPAGNRPRGPLPFAGPRATKAESGFLSIGCWTTVPRRRSRIQPVPARM